MLKNQIRLTIPQHKLREIDARELFITGPGESGKTWALALDAVKYAGNPNYRGLVLVRDFHQLNKDWGILNALLEILDPASYVFNQSEMKFRFSSEAILTLSYRDRGTNWIYRFGGASYHYVGLDDAEEVSARDYKFMLGRQHRWTDRDDPPLRMRATFRGNRLNDTFVNGYENIHTGLVPAVYEMGRDPFKKE